METIIEIYNNVVGSGNASSGFNTAYDMWPPFILLLIAVTVSAILFIVSSDISKYRRFKKILKFFGRSFSYCAYGMLTVAIIGFPVYMAYMGINIAGDNPGTTVELFKWIGIAIAGFMGFTVIGYITKNRIWKRIWKYHKIEKQYSEYKDNMNELPIKSGE